MKKISITADSTCDLSKELLEKYEIDTIPLHVHLGDRDYLDGANISPEEIYKWSDKYKETPKTSAVSPLEAKVFLEKHLERSQEVICFCISEKMSSTANVMRLAAESLGQKDRVFVIDSQNLSTGIGLQAIEASIMAKQELDAKIIVEKIKNTQKYVRSSFVVNTLTYLYRGGRCNGIATIAGSALKIHPCIEVKNGQMGLGKKYRGKMDKVINDYVKDLIPELIESKKERVFITHSGCEAKVIGSVKETLEEIHYFDDIYITKAGGVIASHCGPGTLGVLFIEKGAQDY